MDRSCESEDLIKAESHPEQKNHITSRAEYELVQELAQLLKRLVLCHAGCLRPAEAECMINRSRFLNLLLLQLFQAVCSKYIVDSSAYLRTRLGSATSRGYVPII